MTQLLPILKSKDGFDFKIGDSLYLPERHYNDYDELVVSIKELKTDETWWFANGWLWSKNNGEEINYHIPSYYLKLKNAIEENKNILEFEMKSFEGEIRRLKYQIEALKQQIKELK